MSVYVCCQVANELCSLIFPPCGHPSLHAVFSVTLNLQVVGLKAPSLLPIFTTVYTTAYHKLKCHAHYDVTYNEKQMYNGLHMPCMKFIYSVSFYYTLLVFYVEYN